MAVGFLFGQCSGCCGSCDVGDAAETQPSVTVTATSCDCYADHVPLEVPFYAYLSDGIGQPAFRAPPTGDGHAARCRGWEWRASISESALAECTCQSGDLIYPPNTVEINLSIGVRCCPRDEHNAGNYNGTGGLKWTSGPRGVPGLSIFCDTQQMTGIEVTIGPAVLVQADLGGFQFCEFDFLSECGVGAVDLEVVNGELTGVVEGVSASGCTMDLEFGNPLP